MGNRIFYGLRNGIIISIILWILILILVIGCVEAVPTNVSMKFLGKEMSHNANQCMAAFEPIPDKYFEGVKVIKFYDYHFQRLGKAYPTGLLAIYNRCDTRVMIHELAHFQEFVNGRTVRDARKHDEVFRMYEKEIWNATYSKDV